MKNLASFKEQLKDVLVHEGMVSTIKSLREQIPTDSTKYNVLLQIQAAYQELEKSTLKGTLTLDQLNIESNKLRDRLMIFIDTLGKEDFIAQKKGTKMARKNTIRRGHVLYQIPKKMQLYEESRCLIRIAFDRETLLEELQIDEDTQVKDNIRLSEWMRVTIIDPASSPVFEIRTTSESEQAIAEDDHTEWRFYVKPLVPGKHLLELKVIVMIVAENGTIKPREKVLEETVVIVAEPVAEEEASFEEMATDLIMGGGMQTRQPASSRFRLPKNIQTLAILLLFVFGSGSIAYAVAPQQVDWINTRYLQNSETAYQDFIDKYKEQDSPLVEDATYRKAKVTQDPDHYEDYIQAYNDGKFIEESIWKVAELTEEPEAFARYLHRIPDTIRQRIVRERIAIAKQSLQDLEPKLREQALQANNLTAIDRYLQIYPESAAKDTVLQRLDDSTLWKTPLIDTPAILPGSPATLSERVLTYTKDRNTTASFQHFIEYTSKAPLLEEAKKELQQRTKEKIIDQVQLAKPAASTEVVATDEPNPQTPSRTQPKSNEPKGTVADAIGENTQASANQPPADKATDPLQKKQQDQIAESNQEATQTGSTSKVPTPDTAAAQPSGNDQIAIEEAPNKSADEQPKGPATSPAEMVLIQGGTFIMGDIWGDGLSDEKPTHQVRLKSFYLSRFELTFDEYDAYCLANGLSLPEDEGWGRGKRPVINISWQDAVKYCNWRSQQEGFQPVYEIDGTRVTPNWSANGYRLPTEAEWEFAARSGGKKEKWAGTSDEDKLSSYGNYYNGPDGYDNTAPVGSFRANDLGLYDMSGNVLEWCWDWYEGYAESAQSAPKGPSSGTLRVLRGGSWFSFPALLRCSVRSVNSPSDRFYNIGFRLSRAAP